MSQVDIARERLKTMSTMDDLVRVQTTLKDAEDFLNYLAQMESITK
jgi:3-dehydroquinate dehydratase